jgi:tRNA threonylcarbamoyladenosine biosynthesis protein TsaB
MTSRITIATMTRTVLLALDTSTEFCSVALLLDQPAPATAFGSVAELESGPVFTVAPHYSSGTLHIWFRHEATGPVSSTRLLPAIRELFDEAGLALADCAAIAFGSGPGSFTGLRTATGVAQGLAFGLGIPVVPVGTLLACAEFARLNEPSATRVLSALDARMEEAYWADFAWDETAGDWLVHQAASLDVPDAIALPDVPFILAGNAAAVFGARMPAVSAARKVDGGAVPHALPVALAGLRGLAAGRSIPADQAAPEYVRNKVAQTTVERLEARAVKDAKNAQANARDDSPGTLDDSAHSVAPEKEPIR